jgi:CRISPR-associated protein Cas1
MKEDYYITQDGGLTRHENTVYFENENTKRALPVNKIYSIYAYGRLSFSSGVVDYLAKSGIPIHFFNYYGFYEGSFYPRETLISGDLTVKQASHYLDSAKRLILAKSFVNGACGNILRNLNYYTALDEIFPENYRIIKRSRMPPGNRMNTLISFGNSLMYTTTLSEIYNTQLNPTISFLHEPFERRFSLALDVSEIFKPIIIDRIILKLVNKNMLDDECFRGEIGDMLLNDKGKKLFLTEYNEKLSTTIKHRGLEQNVSFKRLIRLELYKLVKHCLGEKDYKPLIMWWYSCM